MQKQVIMIGQRPPENYPVRKLNPLTSEERACLTSIFLDQLK